VSNVLNTRFALAFAMMIALFGAFALAGRAKADPVVPTTAVVSGGAVAPNIECKWELPDMDSATPGIQYNNDDQPSVYPTPPFPCSGTPPTQPNGATNMIQVAPNPLNQPEERRIQLWTAVDHPNGTSNISDVYWKVFHPDGTFKIQVHGTRVPVAECEAYGSGSSAVTTMFGSAVATHQVAAASIDDINKGIVTKCKQNEKALYYAEFQLAKEQPCGAYKIEEHAVSNGAESVLTNYINVLCTYYMQLDFSTVDYGTITPGLTKVASGDFLFLPPNDTAPTVLNAGNSGLGLSVSFSPMVQQNTPGGKIIDQFDACFARLRAGPGEDGSYTLQCIDPIFAGTTAAFDDTSDRVLCSDEVGKLDFSIHPPSTLPAGTYAGTVSVIARSVPTCPTDLGHVQPGF
jgi:hypothetical protein